MNKIIYEKKYPKRDIAAVIEELDKTSAVPTGEEQEDARTFFETMEQRTRCVPIPERQEMAAEFIRRAIRVSELYDLDTLITRKDGHISVDYSFDFAGSMSALRLVLEMADDYAFFKGFNNRDITMSIDYYTHTVYLGERKVAPDEWD